MTENEKKEDQYLLITKSGTEVRIPQSVFDKIVSGAENGSSVISFKDKNTKKVWLLINIANIEVIMPAT